MTELKETKRQAFERLMQGEHVLVHLDSSQEGVVVPPHLKGNLGLTLKFSSFFQGAIALDDHEIKANLVFSGNYFECIVPWDAIWGMTSENRECFLWAEGFPMIPSYLKSQERRKEASEQTTKLVREEVELTDLDNKRASASVNRKAVRKAVLRRVK